MANLIFFRNVMSGPKAQRAVVTVAQGKALGRLALNFAR